MTRTFSTKLLLNYLNSLKNKLYILSVVLLFSCQSETEYDKLNSYLKKEHDYYLTQDIKAIAIITEKGGCMNCNKSFSDFISTKLDDPAILFLICSTGMMLDISFYLDNQNNKNVLFDQHDRFAETKLIEKSGVIFLKETAIDTVVEIDMETKEESFETIRILLNID